MILTFTEEDHVYRVDGRQVDSVTQLIRLAGRATDYSGVPAFVLERARERGIHIDLACDLDDAGTLDWESVHPQWAGYVQAWRAYKRKHVVTVFATQLRLYHPELDYAGSADALVIEDGERTMVDRKTSKELHLDPYGLQLAAYTMPGIMVADPVTGELAPLDPVGDNRGIVKLLSTGGYQLRHCTDPTDYDDWTAAVRLARRAQRYGTGRAAA